MTSPFVMEITKGKECYITKLVCIWENHFLQQHTKLSPASEVAWILFKGSVFISFNVTKVISSLNLNVQGPRGQRVDLYTYYIVANHEFEEQEEIALSKTGKYRRARVSSEINYLALVKNHTLCNWQKEGYIKSVKKTWPSSFKLMKYHLHCPEEK